MRRGVVSEHTGGPTGRYTDSLTNVDRSRSTVPKLAGVFGSQERMVVAFLPLSWGRYYTRLRTSLWSPPYPLWCPTVSPYPSWGAGYLRLFPVSPYPKVTEGVAVVTRRVSGSQYPVNLCPSPMVHRLNRPPSTCVDEGRRRRRNDSVVADIEGNVDPCRGGGAGPGTPHHTQTRPNTRMFLTDT